MMRVCLAALIFVIVTVNAGESPNGVELLKILDVTRYSNDVIEDASLDAPGLIIKYGYPLEIHEVTTSDGYHLQMHRIPHGRDANNDPNVDRPVVFLQHGLLSSSADWITMGPGCALGYLLAEEGYDVWMGNFRGNFYSRSHLKLNPDSWLSGSFWDFSWEAHGLIDLPEMIDYVLQETGKSKIHYVGHSMGTTAFWIFASMNPQYNDKIISMHALSPVAYMTNVHSLLLRLLAPYANAIETIGGLLGFYEFLPNNDIMTWAGMNLCMDENKYQSLCTNILFLIGGRNEEQLNTTMIPVILGHTPAGASVKQLAHYGQGIDQGYFRRYNFGWISNLLRYGSRNPPSYPLDKISAPVFLHYSDLDPLADPTDVDRLFKELPTAIGKFRVAQNTFSHLDYLWAINAKELVWDRMITLMRSMELVNS